MIISQLLGGLGNQLFQYAAGRALAHRRGVPLRLDISAFEAYRLRSCAISHFHIEAAALTRRERRKVGLCAPPRTRLGRFLKRVLPSSAAPVVRERGFEFDPTLLDAPATCLLQGYWQSPKYFVEIESKIRQEFTIADPLVGENLEMARRIGDCVAVALHVRRGDYANNAETNRVHGTCSPEYYAAAESKLRGKLGRIHLFVFSDDPDWAEFNLRFESPSTILRQNGPERDYEDLRLMTLCRHHIIANSTFSWWGAWLCEHPDKIVIAPRKWFREAGSDTSDLVPEQWIRL